MKSDLTIVKFGFQIVIFNGYSSIVSNASFKIHAEIFENVQGFKFQLNILDLLRGIFCMFEMMQL